MIIKVGNIVSHVSGEEWGVGKVLEVTPTMANIHFSDGKSRKIASSHYSSLRAAATDSYLPPTETASATKALRPAKTAKKKK